MSAFGDVKVSTINGGPTGAKNAIINGNFGINQRGVSGTVTLSAGDYGHDRWKAGASGCTYTFATSNNVTTIDISAGSLIQVIEGINLESGTYTLSWTGTAQGKIGAGSYGNSGITGTATGGTNLDIEFDTGTVSLVQFELGTVVTPFERRPFGTELALCQRYAWKYGGEVSDKYLAGTGLFFNVDTIYCGPIQNPVTMRATPSMTTFGTPIIKDNGVAVTGFTAAISNPSNQGVWVEMTKVGHGLTNSLVLNLNTATTSDYFIFSAEL
jgi:hypothetical protein